MSAPRTSDVAAAGRGAGGDGELLPRRDDRPRVVVLGAGFGGLYAARALRRAPVDVVVVDRRNHHLFQPLLYQVATAGLAGANIAAPIRKVLRRQRNVTVLLAEACAVEPTERRVRFAEGALSYDALIVATGATHAYFGHDEWAELAPGLKTLADAMEIRRRVLLAFERAEREGAETARRAHLTFVVVGAGPTGVELAGALAELARHTLRSDFRRIDPATARVILVEGGDDVLPPFPAELRAKARRQLERLGVEVRTGTLVTGIDADGVDLGAERLAARTVLWAAGVQASPLGATLGCPLDEVGRIEVQPDLSVPGHPRVLAIGDCARIAHGRAEVPGVAPAAIQAGRHAARNALRVLAGRPTEPFRYVDKGTLATIGRASAVADFGWLRLSGPIAWLLWIFVHIAFLIGFRNRVVLAFEWTWAWLTYQRVARVVPERGSGSADGEGARADGG